jgi:hypothetical protein
MTRFALLFVGLLLSAHSISTAEDHNKELFAALGRDDCVVVPLWPKGVGPGETKPQLVEGVQKAENGTILFRPVVNAEMIIIPPPKGVRPSGVTFVFCPGGGYGALETASITQGTKWLAEMGATAVLLKYRIPRRSAELPAHHLPLMDAQRALGLLRSRAQEWKLDPGKIGIIGFSAGGHLAAMASNHHTARGSGAGGGADVGGSHSPNFPDGRSPGQVHDWLRESHGCPAQGRCACGTTCIFLRRPRWHVRSLSAPGLGF